MIKTKFSASDFIEVNIFTEKKCKKWNSNFKYRKQNVGKINKSATKDMQLLWNNFSQKITKWKN